MNTISHRVQSGHLPLNNKRHETDGRYSWPLLGQTSLGEYAPFHTIALFISWTGAIGLHRRILTFSAAVRCLIHFRLQGYVRVPGLDTPCPVRPGYKQHMPNTIRLPALPPWLLARGGRLLTFSQ